LTVKFGIEHHLDVRAIDVQVDQLPINGLHVEFVISRLLIVVFNCGVDDSLLLKECLQAVLKNGKKFIDL
jgi:hypothetical protein